MVKLCAYNIIKYKENFPLVKALILVRSPKTKVNNNNKQEFSTIDQEHFKQRVDIILVFNKKGLSNWNTRALL